LWGNSNLDCNKWAVQKAKPTGLWPGSEGQDFYFGLKKKSARKTALEAVKTCLSSGTLPEFAAMAIEEIYKYRNKI